MGANRRGGVHVSKERGCFLHYVVDADYFKNVLYIVLGQILYKGEIY